MGKKKGSLSYRKLDVDSIKKTNQRLTARIKERFPNANLGEVSDELDTIIEHLKERAEWIGRPNILLRCLCAIGVVSVVAFLAYFTHEPIVNVFDSVESKGSEFIQAIEAVLSGLFLMGLVLIFLATLEQRFKRIRALEAIHELRAIAHVVDMHQLTKDPSYFLDRAESTKSSPKRVMDWFELVRYLNYCSELLAIIGKLAAFYAQNHEDPIVYDAVNDVENLTNDLAQKIWQKISVLHEGSVEEKHRKFIEKSE